LSQHTFIFSINSKSVWPVAGLNPSLNLSEEAEKVNVYRCFKCFTAILVAFKVMDIFLIKLLTQKQRRSVYSYRFAPIVQPESFSFPMPNENSSMTPMLQEPQSAALSRPFDSQVAASVTARRRWPPCSKRTRRPVLSATEISAGRLPPDQSSEKQHKDMRELKA
jgi:hypothetical protein